MNLAQLIDLVKEILNRKDDSTKRIAALLMLLYIVVQYQPVQDALLAFAKTHHEGIIGGILVAVITALFRSPDKSKLAQASTPTPVLDAIEKQEEKSNAASAGKP